MQKFTIIVVLIMFLTSCTFIPKVVHDTDDRRCNLSTSQRTLDISAEGSDQFLHGCANSSSDSAFGCILLASLYSTATAIISGSVVIVGNTLHWIEKQAKCDDKKAMSDRHAEKE